jgi:alpha-galactosidase
LDLTQNGAYEHVLGQVDAVLSSTNISYIKWDHNRILNDISYSGVPTIHAQTEAIYKLFDELKKRHPGLEIESCASGGARVDLGMIEHADRFWASDNNDALERQTIQRWTGIAIPPELLGTHIGPTQSHQTGRTLELSFRAITALFGHAGIEWDITRATLIEREILSNWANYYKSKRKLLHSGKVIRVDHSDETAYVYGVVAHDRSEAIIAFAQLEMASANFPDLVRIPNLNSLSTYKIRVVREVGMPKTLQIRDPEWMHSNQGLVMSGAELARIGFTVPILSPANAILFEVTEIK